MPSLNAINDLVRHTQPLAQQYKEKIASVIDKGWFILGTEVKTFEDNFARYCGTNYCITVANGTEALEIGLKSIGIATNCRVATVANAGMYSTTAIYSVGATPLFVDIDPETLNISIDDLKKKLTTTKIDAIIVTHLYGRSANIEEVCRLAETYKFMVIEDCAQAHGASIAGKKVGSFGDLGCFSFYPTKNLGALGDGGAIVTNNQKLKDEVLLIRQYGWNKKYHVVKVGCKNSRMDEIQAAILNIKLEHLDHWNARRRHIVKTVSERCQNMRTMVFPKNLEENYVGHLFVVKTGYREQLAAFLKQKNISTDIHYPIPDHKQELHSKKFDGLSLPTTESISREILTLPCFPEMSDEDIEYLGSALLEFDQCYR